MFKSIENKSPISNSGGDIVISGIYKQGSGGASQISDELFNARCKIAKSSLIRGTFNIHVANLNEILETLGRHHFESDVDNEKLGSLRWWKVIPITERFKNLSGKTFLVRHYHTNTNYLELTSEIDFRKHGLQYGDNFEFSIMED